MAQRGLSNTQTAINRRPVKDLWAAFVCDHNALMQVDGAERSWPGLAWPPGTQRQQASSNVKTLQWPYSMWKQPASTMTHDPSHPILGPCPSTHDDLIIEIADFVWWRLLHDGYAPSVEHWVRTVTHKYLNYLCCGSFHSGESIRTTSEMRRNQSSIGSWPHCDRIRLITVLPFPTMSFNPPKMQAADNNGCCRKSVHYVALKLLGKLFFFSFHKIQRR